MDKTSTYLSRGLVISNGSSRYADFDKASYLIQERKIPFLSFCRNPSYSNFGKAEIMPSKYSSVISC